MTDNFTGLGRVRVSQDAIEEFRVIAHRFDAEIGSSSGAAISVVTKSGTNTLHGSALAAHRSDTLRSKGALETNDVDFSRTHVSATIGGPIVADRTHYFLSTEFIEQDDAKFFRPRGAFTHLAEDVPHPIRQRLGLVSLDHARGPSSQLLAKLSYERYREDNYDVGGVRAQSYGWSFNRDSWNLLLGHTRIFGPTQLNELRAQVGAADGDWPLNSEEMTESFSRGTTLIIGRATGGEFWLDRSHLSLRDSLHLMPTERHQVKVGLSYFQNRMRYIQDVWDAGEMEYLTDDRTLPFLYTYGVGSSLCSIRSHDVGLFVQDDWMVNEESDALSRVAVGRRDRRQQSGLRASAAAGTAWHRLEQRPAAAGLHVGPDRHRPGGGARRGWSFQRPNDDLAEHSGARVARREQSHGSPRESTVLCLAMDPSPG